MRWSLWAVLAAVGVSASLEPGVLRAEPEKPKAARRLVKFWDFEDELSRVEPVPPDWFRAQDNPPSRERPSHPAWNVPTTSEEQAFSGVRSVYVPTRGGSASLTLAGGVLPAMPEADYALIARVRTDGLRHARAVLTIRFLSQDLAQIPGGERSSVPIVSQDEWTQVEALLTGRANAAWIQLELQVLQPRDLDGPSAPDVARQDFRGGAYFDDVVVYQVPRLALTVGAGSGIHVGDKPPDISASVRDLTGEPLDLRGVVYDLAGNPAWEFGAAEPASGRRLSWTPVLPAYGWYRVALEASGKNARIGLTHVDFVWGPPSSGTDPVARQSFGVIAEGLAADRLDSLPELVRGSEVGSVTMSVWPTGKPHEEAAARSQHIAERLLNEGFDVSLSLNNFPPEVVRSSLTSPDDALGIFLVEGDPWAAPLGRIMSTLGERVRRWQFGPLSALDAGAAHASSATESVRARLRRLIPRPLVTLPASLAKMESTRRAGPDALVVHWAAGESESALDAMNAAEGRAEPAPERTLVIEPLDADLFGRSASCIDLARRATRAWARGERRLALESPWTFPSEEEAIGVFPSAELAVWRTLSLKLAGSRILGTLPIADGAVAYIADTPRGGMLVAWNDFAKPDDAAASGLFGQGEITATDLFGNTVPLEFSSDGSTRVSLRESPIFIEGVDLPLTRFRAAARLDPGFLPARAEKHAVDLVLENPWPHPVTGRVRLVDDGRWTIAPRVMSFSLAAGATQRLPFDVSFTLGEESGTRVINSEIEVYSDQRLPVIRVPLRVDIGLSSVDLLPSYRLDPRADGGGDDVVVTATVTNISDLVLTIEVFAQAPGYRAFEAPVIDLQPGESVVRRFRFDHGAQKLKGKQIRVGLKEQDGTGRLNKSLTVE